MPASRPLTILMLTDVYFPRINGVSTSLSSFRGALERQGHTVTRSAPTTRWSPRR